ncbi:MAG: hypothetical protein WCG01_04090 [bacterium]
MKKLNKILLVACFLLMPLYDLEAATLSLDSSASEYGLGDQIGVDIRLNLDQDEECINTGEIGVTFDNTILEALDFSTGESIFSLWIDRPASEAFANINAEQVVKFSGGVPGGYCGKVPGDQGVSNSLGRIIFKVIGTDQQLAKLPVTRLAFDNSSKILQNNGLGSEAKLKLTDLSLVIKPKLVKQNTDWDQVKTTDYLAPEEFTIELLKDPALYNGQYYLMFNTVDKQSGLDHYEVSEQRVITSVYQKIYDGLLSVLPGREQKNANWQVVTPPYVLKDQKLNSTIRVKAVDKAGNQYVVERAPQAWFSRQEIIVSIVVFVVLLFIIALLVLRIQKKLNSKGKI